MEGITVGDIMGVKDNKVDVTEVGMVGSKEEEVDDEDADADEDADENAEHRVIEVGTVRESPSGWSWPDVHCGTENQMTGGL